MYLLTLRTQHASLNSNTRNSRSPAREFISRSKYEIIPCSQSFSTKAYTLFRRHSESRFAKARISGQENSPPTIPYPRLLQGLMGFHTLFSAEKKQSVAAKHLKSISLGPLKKELLQWIIPWTFYRTVQLPRTRISTWKRGGGTCIYGKLQSQGSRWIFLYYNTNSRKTTV